jgi:hypothetical protein
MSMIIDLAILDSIQGIGITGMVAYFFCEIVYTSTKSKIVSNRVDKTKIGEAQNQGWLKSSMMNWLWWYNW